MLKRACWRQELLFLLFWQPSACGKGLKLLFPLLLLRGSETVQEDVLMLGRVTSVLNVEQRWWERSLKR